MLQPPSSLCCKNTTFVVFFAFKELPMDVKGYEAITAAFTEAGMTAYVIPQPQGDENVRFVTVETGLGVAPATVLNALGAASLLQQPGSQDVVRRTTPELQVLSVQPGSATFEDINKPRRH
jgi:hypothetical protein